MKMECNINDCKRAAWEEEEVLKVATPVPSLAVLGRCSSDHDL